MIESVQIKKAATFGDAPENLDGLLQLNFIYGANGTGKTTISRAIADEARFQDCKVIWRGGTKLEALVYNRDFIDRNFGQTSDLKGIFTLGEKDKTTLDKIVAAKAHLSKLLLPLPRRLIICRKQNEFRHIPFERRSPRVVAAARRRHKSFDFDAMMQ